jgi:hypothetical protein
MALSRDRRAPITCKEGCVLTCDFARGQFPVIDKKHGSTPKE